VSVSVDNVPLPSEVSPFVTESAPPGTGWTSAPPHTLHHRRRHHHHEYLFISSAEQEEL